MKIVATFSYRYDEDFVPGLLKNIEWVDDVVMYDDTKRKGLWCHEGDRKKELVKRAKEKGADWILHVSPDERFENHAEQKIRALMEKHKDDNVCIGFRLREMFTVDHYRVDGIWGMKRQYRLVRPWGLRGNHSIQQSMRPLDAELVDVNINLYHFKHLDEKSEQIRAAVFKELDPNNERQEIGYDYLTDRTGMKLEKIPAFREYYPKFDPSLGYKWPKEYLELIDG